MQPTKTYDCLELQLLGGRGRQGEVTTFLITDYSLSSHQRLAGPGCQHMFSGIEHAALIFSSSITLWILYISRLLVEAGI